MALNIPLQGGVHGDRLHRIPVLRVHDNQCVIDVVLLLLDFDTGESVRARTTLNADQYAIALDAHESQAAFILVHGELSMSGRQPRALRKVNRFERIKHATI